ncbi:MAG: hypothetical protein E6713_02325 [Sporomusaceae bacterium]|nr:hypothetical protein [Sporomusaceae bacterium]
MKRVGKKIMIYSLVGMMQIGWGVSVLEASPLTQENRSVIQLDDRHHMEREREHEERQREHDRRMREEQKRHEHEMRRHPHESEREWHRRQEQERERHEREMRIIAAVLIGAVIASSGN